MDKPEPKTKAQKNAERIKRKQALRHAVSLSAISIYEDCPRASLLHTGLRLFNPKRTMPQVQRAFWQCAVADPSAARWGEGIVANAQDLLFMAASVRADFYPMQGAGYLIFPAHLAHSKFKDLRLQASLCGFTGQMRHMHLPGGMRAMGPSIHLQVPFDVNKGMPPTPRAYTDFLEQQLTHAHLHSQDRTHPHAVHILRLMRLLWKASGVRPDSVRLCVSSPFEHASYERTITRLHADSMTKQDPLLVQRANQVSALRNSPAVQKLARSVHGSALAGKEQNGHTVCAAVDSLPRAVLNQAAQNTQACATCPFAQSCRRPGFNPMQSDLSKHVAFAQRDISNP